MLLFFLFRLMDSAVMIELGIIAMSSIFRYKDSVVVVNGSVRNTMECTLQLGTAIQTTVIGNELYSFTTRIAGKLELL